MPFAAVGGAVAASVAGSVISSAMSPSSSSGSTSATAFNPQLTGIANSGTSAAKLDSQTSANQLQWAQQLYGSTQGQSQSYLDNMLSNSNSTAAGSSTALSGLSGTAAAVGTLQNEGQAAYDTATAYGSQANADKLAGGAQADVASASEAARQSSTRNLESYGIDPSQTRYGALDLSSRIQQGASQAAAGTASYQNTYSTSQALKASAMTSQAQGISAGTQLGSLGSGLASTSSSAASAGISGQDSRASTFGNLEGSPTTWAGLGTSALSGASSALGGASSNANTGYNEQNAASNSLGQGLGSAIGGGLQYANQNGMFSGGSSTTGSDGYGTATNPWSSSMV